MVAAVLRFSGNVGLSERSISPTRISISRCVSMIPGFPLTMRSITGSPTGLLLDYGSFGLYSGAELKRSRIETIIPHTIGSRYSTSTKSNPTSMEQRFTGSFCGSLLSGFARRRPRLFPGQLCLSGAQARGANLSSFRGFLVDSILPLLEEQPEVFHLALKRFLFHIRGDEGGLSTRQIWSYIRRLQSEKDDRLKRPARRSPTPSEAAA